MISADKLSVIFSLQEIALNTEDSSTLLNHLIPQVYQRINSLGYSYEFILSLSFNTEGKAQQICMMPVPNAPLDLTFLVEAFPKWEPELLWGPLMVETATLKPPFDRPNLQTAVVMPILVAHKITGILIFATTREIEDISKEELEFLEIVTNTVALSFRLQDTQNSLTQISQQVYQMNAKLHELDKLKDDFVSVASHELRTPMTAIRSYAWMALYKPDILLSEKMKKYLSRTLTSTERLINLVNDMLNVSRIESGRIEINPKGFDMLDLAKIVAEEVSAKVNELGVKVVISETKLPQVFADPDKIHQVLLNLVGNALKFTPKGGNITVSFFSDGKVVETHVKDSGVGLSQEDLGRLFKKFGRLDSSYTAVSSSGGTGLGLFISKSLVEIMKGRIWATSEGLNKGATFAFSLPVVTEELLAEAEKYAVRASGGEAKALEPVAI